MVHALLKNKDNKIYRLTDEKDKHFKLVGTVDNIAEYLQYPYGMDYMTLKERLALDPGYHNEYVFYIIEQTRVHIAVRETGEYVADVRDILQGMAVIELFEYEDEGNDDYEPDWYDIVDDDHRSLVYF